jgi:hypothetical protein
VAKNESKEREARAIAQSSSAVAVMPRAEMGEIRRRHLEESFSRAL